MVTLVIIGILFAIAYPSYTHHLVKARRSEAQIALVDLAIRMDQYFIENNHSFTGATLSKLNAQEKTPANFYLLRLAALTNTTFILQALPLNSQARDDKSCQTLTFNQLGQKGNTGPASSAECW